MPITKTKIKKRDIYRTEPTIKHVSGHRPLFIQLITTTEKKIKSLYMLRIENEAIKRHDTVISVHH